MFYRNKNKQRKPRIISQKLIESKEHGVIEYCEFELGKPMKPATHGVEVLRGKLK